MFRRGLHAVRGALGAVAFLTSSGLAPAQTGGYWYETYRYAYNPGYHARRYVASQLGSETNYRYWGYGRNSKTDPGMSPNGPYFRYVPAGRSPSPTDWLWSK